MKHTPIRCTPMNCTPFFTSVCNIYLLSSGHNLFLVALLLMSFGYAVSDFLGIYDRAKAIVDACREGPAEFQELSRGLDASNEH